jgi:hypothetical protein
MYGIAVLRQDQVVPECRWSQEQVSLYVVQYQFFTITITIRWCHCNMSVIHGMHMAMVALPSAASPFLCLWLQGYRFSERPVMGDLWE